MSVNNYSDPFTNYERRMRYEYDLALDCVLPHLSRWGIEFKGASILDLGCGSGGLAVALAEVGAECLGIDLNRVHIQHASRLASEHLVKAEFVAADVLKPNELDRILRGRSFQLVVLAEFVEHLVNLQNVTYVLSQVKEYLAPGGCVYVSFPPWFNPYGGHQAGWPTIRCVPWYHIIPNRLKRFLAPKQASKYLEFFQELNHLTINAFETILEDTHLKIVKRELFHFRPEYYWRYRVPTLRASFLAKVPIVRELTVTGAFYLLTKW
jgi:2-polyprenyl-3-methyl-5-hydroxy-6-metoxy-1,4-benzoquinol methylase